MKKVLVITYYFPPRPGMGSIRLRGLAKYLPDFGWKPTILTAKLPEDPDIQFDVVQTYYPGNISEIIKRKINLNPQKGFQEQIGIPYNIRGRKSSITGELINIIKEIIAYPDEEKTWYPYAINEGAKLLKYNNFDAILSSSGPVIVNLIANKLKTISGLPWIADFRDLWTQNPYYKYNKIRMIIEKRLEVKTLNAADILITTSIPLANKLKALHNGKQVFTITNGFDPEELVFSDYPLTKKFTITYTGQLYQGKRDPEPLLKVIHNLIKTRIINPRNIEIRFFGPKQYWLDKEIEKYYLREVVKQYGTVPRRTALLKQRESQILLLLQWNNPQETGVYTGKIFEYLAAHRPILAIGGPGGVVKNLLDETGAGIHISKLEELYNTLSKCYKEYQFTGKIKYRGNMNKIQKYSQREIALEFAQILNTVVH